MLLLFLIYSFFFFNDTATTEIYTLSLHDALPICSPSTTRTHESTRPAGSCSSPSSARRSTCEGSTTTSSPWATNGRCESAPRSEEHTSELQSRSDLVCRLLLEKKKK